MSNLLIELLGENNHLLKRSLAILEKASGDSSIDVKLVSDIAGRTRIKTKSLGLDPDDSTGKEVYHALVALVKHHEEFLIKRIGAKPTDTYEDLMIKIIEAIRKIKLPKKSWVIKLSVAKKMLKLYPPKKTMKHLGYRSVESMIKRESIYEIYCGMRILEDEAWLNNYIRKYNTLKPSDFETRDIKIILLDNKKWKGVAKTFVRQKHHNITNLKELGAIFVLPLPAKQTKGIILATFYQIIKYINEIRMYSSYFKMQQVKPDFGQILVNTIIEDPSKHVSIAGNDLHWRIVQRYFGKLDDNSHPDIFQPHVQLDDLYWRKPEEVLYELEPALHFWFDMDYVAKIFDGLPISYNLIDCVICYANELPYKKRYFQNYQENLRNELFTRYLNRPNLRTQVINQIDKETSADNLSISIDIANFA